jgi:hypothetical protein
VLVGPYQYRPFGTDLRHGQPVAVRVLHVVGSHTAHLDHRQRHGAVHRGETLTEHWAEGMHSKHGMHVHGFPNLFIVGPSQGSNLISNITQNLTEAGTTIATIVNHALAAGATEVEVSREAELEWIALLESNPRAFGGNPDCTPGYYNNEGRPMGRKERLGGSGYPMGPVAYWQYLDEWRNNGRFDGLDFR